MSSILPATSADPVGAVALLECGDPLELERFVALENAMWEETTLAPAVVETVRLHCAHVRGCEFCKAVRYTAAIDDGLTETQISNLDVQAARQEFSADVVSQPIVQHNGLLGNGFRLENIVPGAEVEQPEGYVENAPKDMVTALPDQITRIKTTFDKPGRYVWHCHILSHEDHEMMRVLHVGPGA